MSNTFRQKAAQSLYPFTRDSTYTTVEDYKIPYSTFLDCVLYPKEYPSRDVYLSRIQRNTNGVPVIYFTDGIVEWYALMEGEVGVIYDRTREPVGTIVTDGDVLKGYRWMDFAPRAMRLLPSLIIPVKRPTVNVSVDGVRVERMDKGLKITSWNSPRISEEEIEGVKTGKLILDKYVGVTQNVPVVKTFNGEAPENRPVYIRIDPRSNLKVTDDGEGIFFYKKGDPYEL